MDQASGAAARGMMTTATDGAVIRLESICKSYDGTTVIDRLDLAVLRGEFLTLLGPSGCGKTTTLRIIAGFEQPESGRVLLDGEDVAGLPPYRRPLNTVFQHYALFPHMSVFDNVAFGPRTTGLPRAEIRHRVDEALALTGMAAHARKRPGQLSGGQQQRVALARALVNRPAALLLDEPLSALDVKLRRAMQIELKRLQAEVHTTFIFVTHDQEEALTMSSRIAVMNEGRIEQLDRPEMVYARPASAFVAGFVGQANLLPVRVLDVAGERARLVLPEGGEGFAACPAGLRAGGGALLMVRPEQILLAPEGGGGKPGKQGDDPAAENGCALSARVASLDFQGAVLRCELECGGGRRMVASLPARSRGGLSPGTAVRIGWRPEEAWVVANGAPETINEAKESDT
jgi:spermidine/putrescine transport system ATP-binding protein